MMLEAESEQWIVDSGGSLDDGRWVCEWLTDPATRLADLRWSGGTTTRPKLAGQA